jgi:hypothetical protein
MTKIRSIAWVTAALGAAGLAAGVAHAVVVKGRGELLARGNGVAVLQLRGAISANGFGLAVVEADALVETQGEGRVTPLGDGRLLLEGFGGIVVRSPDEPTRLEIAGAGLRLRARGVGIARLRGTGAYSTDDVDGRWGPDHVVELEEGDRLE